MKSDSKKVNMVMVIHLMDRVVHWHMLFSPYTVVMLILTMRKNGPSARSKVQFKLDFSKLIKLYDIDLYQCFKKKICCEFKYCILQYMILIYNYKIYNIKMFKNITFK